MKKEEIVSGQIKTLELKYNEHGTWYLDYEVSFPSYTENEFKTFKDMIRDIISEIIMEIYTEETGHLWKVFLHERPTTHQMSLLRMDLRSYSKPEAYLK